MLDSFGIFLIQPITLWISEWDYDDYQMLHLFFGFIGLPTGH